MTARDKHASPAAGTDRETSARSRERSAPGPGRGALHPALRGIMKRAQTLRDIHAGVPRLTTAQRAVLVEQALILIEQNYAHLPLKKAMHAVDPVQRLRLLQLSLKEGLNGKRMSDAEFHRELTATFTSVRDLHTNYLLPAPFNELHAFLPFMVEECCDGGKTKYLVSHITPGFARPPFKRSVEILFWNGVPIERAVAINAERFAGSNLAARHARGIQALTNRALIVAPPPDEEWVIVRYRDSDGRDRECRFDWLVTRSRPQPIGPRQAAGSPSALGLDLEQYAIQDMRKFLYAPKVAAAESRQRARASSRRRAATAKGATLKSRLPAVFEARSIKAKGGPYGYLRIRTFNIWPIESFLDEYERLLSALPRNGLIIDVRGNGGGVISNGELALQTLTPQTIEPEPFQFINTQLNLELCSGNDAKSKLENLSRWVESMKEAQQTGATFSAGFPLTDPQWCNEIGQLYFGPVVLIVDALCYSTTDIFAAGFQDHEIGTVLGVDASTGAGGATLWTQAQYLELMRPGRRAVYRPLPKGSGMTLAGRRALRVGRRAGSPLEDLGVIPTKFHRMTRRDLVDHNRDLIAKACSLLARRTRRDLRVTTSVVSSTKVSVDVQALRMTRIEVYLYDRPLQSHALRKGRATFEVVMARPGTAFLTIKGFERNALVGRWVGLIGSSLGAGGGVGHPAGGAALSAAPRVARSRREMRSQRR